MRAACRCSSGGRAAGCGRRWAAEASLTQNAILRIWQAFGQQHRAETFKLSEHPLFVEKIHDVVGLYLNPPEHAVVVWVARSPIHRRSRDSLQGVEVAAELLGERFIAAQRVLVDDRPNTAEIEGHIVE